MTIIRRFLAALQFLTVLQVPTPFPTEELGRSAPCFPFVGLAIGGLTVVVDLAAGAVGIPWSVRTVIAVMVPAIVSGGLHLDGLADTADGFWSSRSRDKILEIMRDSRIGTMGVLALLAILGLKAAAVSDLATGPWRTIALLLAPILGRSLQVVGLTWMPYARPEGGLATVFLPYRSGVAGVFACVVPVALLGAMLGMFQSNDAFLPGLITILLLIAAMAFLIAWWGNVCRDRIGGMTGDTLGALSELGETLFLLVICRVAAAVAIAAGVCR
ncbi:MAG: adenosylcobinamide-GDP ribazoletransferase [Candidatus Ozemobacteraceae bacterium]